MFVLVVLVVVFCFVPENESHIILAASEQIQLIFDLDRMPYSRRAARFAVDFAIRDNAHIVSFLYSEVLSCIKSSAKLMTVESVCKTQPERLQIGEQKAAPNFVLGKMKPTSNPSQDR